MRTAEGCRSPKTWWIMPRSRRKWCSMRSLTKLRSGTRKCTNRSLRRGKRTMPIWPKRSLTMMNEAYHQPVLLKESVDGLNIKADGVYVDATFGGGGHSREILRRLGEGGRLLAFDQDEDALQNALDDERFRLIDQNFRYLKQYL